MQRPDSISNKASPILVSEFKLSHSITLGELSLSLSLRERWVTQKTIQFGELQSTTCLELRSPSRATESAGTHGLESCHMEELCWSQQAMFIGQVPVAVYSDLPLQGTLLTGFTMSTPAPPFLGAAPARDRAWWGHTGPLLGDTELLQQTTLTQGSPGPSQSFLGTELQLRALSTQTSSFQTCSMVWRFPCLLFAASSLFFLQRGRQTIQPVDLAACFVKFCWNTAISICLYITYGCFWGTTAELNSCNRDSIAHRPRVFII